MAIKFRQGLNRYHSFPVQIRATIWFLVCSFLQKGISSITGPIFTRLLTTEEYGRFSVFNSWLEIVSIFVSLNIASGVYMQGMTKFSDRRKEYTSSMHGLTMLLVAGWAAVYLLTRNFWNSLFSLTTVQMLAMLLMIWTTAVFGFWSASERVEFRYRKLVLVTALVSVAKPAVGIFLVLHAEDKVTARILGLVAVEIVGYSALALSQMVRGKKLYIREFWRHAIWFSVPLVPHCLSQTVLNSSDRIMIGHLVGDDAAGIYSVAYTISQLMTLFTSALQQTLEPWRYAKQKAGKQEEIAKLAYSTLILIAGLNLVLMAFAPEIVRIFAPVEYYDAIWVIPPVAMSVYYMFAYGYFASFEFYFEKTGYIAAATVGGALLNVGLNYIFIRIFGYYAAGYTTLVCYMVYTACHYIAMRKICRDLLGGKRVYSLRRLLAISSIFMMCGFGLLFTYRYPLVRYGIIIVCSVLLVFFRKRIVYLIKQLISVRNSSGKE